MKTLFLIVSILAIAGGFWLTNRSMSERIDGTQIGSEADVPPVAQSTASAAKPSRPGAATQSLAAATPRPASAPKLTQSDREIRGQWGWDRKGSSLDQPTR